MEKKLTRRIRILDDKWETLKSTAREEQESREKLEGDKSDGSYEREVAEECRVVKADRRKRVYAAAKVQ